MFSILTIDSYIHEILYLKGKFLYVFIGFIYIDVSFLDYFFSGYFSLFLKYQ